jgi:hypothetical protein
MGFNMIENGDFASKDHAWGTYFEGGEATLSVNDKGELQLDIQKEGGWLNETVLLPDRKGDMALEVLTERAVILTVPLDKAHIIMDKTPLMPKCVIQYVIRQMEKYQRLWIQS